VPRDLAGSPSCFPRFGAGRPRNRLDQPDRMALKGDYDENGKSGKETEPQLAEFSEYRPENGRTGDDLISSDRPSDRSIQHRMRLPVTLKRNLL